MIGTVLLVVALGVALSAFVALRLWARRSEAQLDWDHSDLTDEQANAARLGIALTVNTDSPGGQ